MNDHEVNQRALALMLAVLKADVVTAFSGKEALEQTASHSFDVILMDVTMEGLSGLEATRRIRTQPGPNRDTPVVAVMGAVGSEAVASYLAAGMTQVVAKPINPAELFSAVQMALDSDHKRSDGRLQTVARGPMDPRRERREAAAPCYVDRLSPPEKLVWNWFW